jgi:uncharacterized protein (TIGR04255 family)
MKAHAKKQLIKAPLVLVQAQIHFSNLPSLELGTAQELENLQKAMIDLGYFEKIDSEVVEIGFEFKLEGTGDGYGELKQHKSNSKRLVFRGFNKTKSVELIQNRLTIKNTQYQGYAAYSDDIKNILDAFTTHLSDFKNVLIKQASLRYIDVILPCAGKELSDYINPNLLPFYPDFAVEKMGISQSITKTGEYQSMVISTEEAKADITGFPSRWLPADMLESDQQAILMLHPYIENYEHGKNYCILSTDHRAGFSEDLQLQTTTVMDQLNNLYTLSSQFFWDAITEKAKQEWEVSTNA